MQSKRHLSLKTAAILSAALATGAQAAITLTGDTSVPTISTMSIGQQVQLTFSAAGMSAGQQLSLNLTYVDEHGTTLSTQTVPFTANSSGNWTGTVTAPSDHLGYYRVNAQLSNGVQLPAVGSRSAGYLTYAVVQDPSTRVDYGEQSFFGMQGGWGNWGNTALSYLGSRWVLDPSFNWNNNEPNQSNVWNGNAGTEASESWKTYKLPTLFMAPQWATVSGTYAYNTGALTPTGETRWTSYCTKAAQAYMAKYPNRQQHIYQITWEPIVNWGYNGTTSQLIRIYQLAYNAIHAVDPKAVVAGPTMFIHGEGVWDLHWANEQQSIALFQQGLGQYIDAYTTHPYYEVRDYSATGYTGTNASEMVNRIQYVVGQMTQYSGKTIPLYGTEQGWRDDGTLLGQAGDANHLPGELGVAQADMQQNLIMMGEGFRFNMGFYIVDYSYNGGGDMGDNRYGYYYNLVNGMPWGPNKASPKPVVAAYAAQSYLLDGAKSVGYAPGMGNNASGNNINGTKWGYKYQRPGESQATMALWDYGNTTSTYTLYTGLDSVLKYDWMGNSQTLTTSNGYLTLTLGQEPIYLVMQPAWGVDSNASWNSNASWTTAAPNGVGAVVNFTGRIAAARTITLDSPVTAGTLYFRNTNSYTIAGNSALTMDVATGNATITVDSGQHTISAPVILNKNLVVTVNDAAGAVNLTGTVNQSAGYSVTKTGAGKLGLSTASTLGGMTVQSGLVQLAAAGGAALRTSSLVISPVGTLDIANGSAIVEYTSFSPLLALNTKVAGGFKAYTWSGSGITSSAAANDVRQLTAVGIIDNASWQAASFGGQSVPTTAVLMKYTYYGDANLDGVVNGDDYTLVDTGYLSHQTGWLFGDFNYDGAINADDYSLIDISYMSQGAQLSDVVSQHGAEFGAAYANAVPEPTTLGLLAVASLGLLGRTRRYHQ